MDLEPCLTNFPLVCSVSTCLFIIKMWPCLFQRIKTNKSPNDISSLFLWRKMVASLSLCPMTCLGGSLLEMPKPLFWVSLALSMCSHAEITTHYCKFLFTNLVSQRSVISWRAPCICLHYQRDSWNADWINTTLWEGEGQITNQEAFLLLLRDSPSLKRFKKIASILDVWLLPLPSPSFIPKLTLV